MNSPKLLIGACCLVAAIASITSSHGQSLPNSFSVSVTGSFQNPVAESENSVLVRDNNLTNGYANGYDSYQAPTGLQSTGPTGSAFFQWGTAATAESYPHPSALWFEPLTMSNVAVEQVFYVGYLHYRNGTINSGTGASAVDLQLSFNLPGGGAPVTTTYTSNLINTPNTGTAAEQADIVSLPNLTTPLNYTDSNGKTYYLELSFQIDADTINNSLSNSSEFRVYEGSVGRAEMVGRITTTPTNLAVVPEPSTLLLGALFPIALFRRQRRA